MALKTTGRGHGVNDKKPELLTTEERGRLGTEIYERDIRHLVEADYVGKIVSIDVDTGAWAMHDDQQEARKLLRKKRPGAVNVFSERVGCRAMGRIRTPFTRRM